MTNKIMIPAIPKLAELRKVVLAQSEKRKPKWGFRLAADVIMELQPQPCMLLNPSLLARGGKQALLSFEGHAVMTPGPASPADLKVRPRNCRSRKFSLLQFDGEPDWQLTFWAGRGTQLTGTDRSCLEPLDAAILASLQDDGIFTKLTPERMLKPACLICGKALTDPASMSRWIGPECAATTSLSTFWKKTDRKPVSAYSIEDANA